MASILKCVQYDMIILKPKIGQLYFCVDSQSLYKDFGPNKEQRLRFNAIILNSDNERVNSVRPELGKFYYVIETNSLWLYDTRWLLKIGDKSKYNTYSYDKEVLSPVINIDSSITNSSGDKIIDNNGLLGNGSVVIRDENRIARGIIKSDNIYKQIRINSYQDDGLLFIPNAHLPYNDLSTSLGALHLTVTKEDNTIHQLNGTLTTTGEAFYYGDWNNYGDMYIVKKENNVNTIFPDYTPLNNKEIVKTYIVCQKMVEIDNEFKLVKTYILIRPLTTTQAVIQIISLYNENATSVVMNDLGELIYTNSGDLLENNIFTCSRVLSIDGDIHIAKYILTEYNDNIILKESITIQEPSIPLLWTESGKPESISNFRWIKKRILTEDDLS